jgi:hypothetical protein
MWLWMSESARKAREKNLHKLHRASEGGDVVTVRDLLKDANVNVNGRDEVGAFISCAVHGGADKGCGAVCGC